jgi:hypothetical protein
MLQNIFQKSNFSTIIIVILLALFLLFAFMRYRKVNEGLEYGNPMIVSDEQKTKKPDSQMNVVINKI